MDDMFYGPDYVAWYKNGQIQRGYDLPAEIWDTGAKYWYTERVVDTPKDVMIDGQLHRDGGKPAVVIWPTGYQEWWIYGKEYTKEQAFVVARKHQLAKVCQTSMTLAQLCVPTLQLLEVCHQDHLSPCATYHSQWHSSTMTRDGSG